MSPIQALILVSLFLSLSGCQETLAQKPDKEEHQKVVVTNPKATDVEIVTRFVCQIHSRRHIEVRALVKGYLDEVHMKEGQTVKQGELMYKILPIVYQAQLDAKQADVRLAQVKLEQSRKLHKKGVVSDVDVALHEAELQNHQADLEQAQAELSFTEIRAKFSGIVDRQYQQEGALLEEGDLLTTLSQNDPMWVYFNMDEARYLNYMSAKDRDDESYKIELKLANGKIFPYLGKIATIEGQFDNTTGNIAFRANFPNPEGLLRHGETGDVLMTEMLKNAIVIPQKAVFEVLANRYVYVLDKEGVVHQREIVVDHEKDDIFIVKSGLNVNDKLVVDGIQLIRDGEKVEAEYQEPDEILGHLKYHAE